MSEAPTFTEAEIFADVIAPNKGDLPPDVARSVLEWKFTTQAAKLMSTLADRNNIGVISESEREELERFLRVGSFINIIQAKARISLRDSTSPS